MATKKETEAEKQADTNQDALADEWAAALEEAGNAPQDDIDALLSQQDAAPAAEEDRKSVV